MVDGSLTKPSLLFAERDEAQLGMAGPTLLRTAYGRRAIAVAAALALCCVSASAQQAPAEPDLKRAEYESVSREMKLSQERIDALKLEIEGVRKDHATITAALIQAAKTEKKLAQDIDDISGRLEGLKGQEAGIRASLAARSGVLAEVLGALERMGLNPPPAILVKPEDALSSVRSAILLGAVVPELREQTEVLIADMRELSRVTGSIEAERSRLMASVAEQLAEKERLDLLLAAKKTVQARTEAALNEETSRAQALAAKAGSLKELIASLDVEAERTRKAAEAQAEVQRRAADAARTEEEKRLAREAEIAALPENNRQLVSLPFSALTKQLQLPVTGRFKLRYGGKDDNGGVMQGDMVATQSGAIVTAPADGNVLYAGRFRSYGQLLILDAGNGYHIVLAGMSRITATSGQSVLSGEPVGAMGEARVADTGASTVTNSPELYIEFRKDGKPVDPAPWWAERLSGRTGNDT